MQRCVLFHLLVAVGRGRELGHLEEILVVVLLCRRRGEEEGPCLEVLGDGHVVPQVPVAERRDLAPLAVVLRLSEKNETEQSLLLCERLEASLGSKKDSV
jgi:hypothetical protein